MNAQVSAATTARRIRESGSFRVDLPAWEAIELFTAEGERLWVPGWHPTILGEGPQEPGLLFLTGEGAEHTIWTVLKSDFDRGEVAYSRVTPGSRAGTVEVKVTAEDNACRVRVAYDLTALSADGEAALDAYEGESFGRMLKEWRRLISRFLVESRGRGAG